eukprot:GHVO01016989.1.p1 GENE.GHVO01016989.1~~GHVO01016989.1.p1  ORF type:complete len:382 (+),score=39.19 GHVO01016989.1:447-1592(+)
MWLASRDLISAVEKFDVNKITAELHNKFEAGIAQDGSQHNRVLTVADNVAQINISGVLTKSYSFMTWLMGGTSYDDISGALALAENDDEITGINIHMNSGGGQVSGLFDLIAQMQSATKPMSCFVSGQCCSAAYAIATQCDDIVASSDGETFGSIGIVIEMHVADEDISVTSTNAPKKRPDARTDEGVADIRAELDEYEELFLESIAEGRNTTVANVIETYGQGASTVARNALTRGMIDGIKSNLKSGQGVPDKTLTANKDEEPLMNIAELQAKHPELYASVLANGKDQGKKDEQTRVAAFAELGEASGATELAMACIKDGTEHSAAVNSRFMAAQMKSVKLQAMDDDNVDASGQQAAAPASKTLDDLTAEAMGNQELEIY